MTPCQIDNFRHIAHQSSNCCIIEIGCSTGETSHLLWQRLSQQNQNKQSPKSSCWIGFDTSHLLWQRLS